MAPEQVPIIIIMLILSVFRADGCVLACRCHMSACVHM